ncbi:MAG: class I SAM-dependent methyltransferase [Candidatus Riflebacteria bacterium]|nr:class I SAM-dependent methyltransferase [Candidatus Riflebacteria bacterium]
MQKVKEYLEHPLTRGKSIDDPSTSELRKEIIKSKPFLYSLYREWYKLLINSLPEINGKILELGSGGGFLAELIPDLIASDIIFLNKLSLICDARSLPFVGDSFKAIVMVNVLHHIPCIDSFFKSASRVLKRGGRIIMIEPWLTKTSKLIYKNMHHELFDEKQKAWQLSTDSPLSSANGALPWIVLQRDIRKFEALFSEFKILKIHKMMPLSYLLSGGVSMRSLIPGFLYSPIRFIENILEKNFTSTGMFALAILEKNAESGKFVQRNIRKQ